MSSEPAILTTTVGSYPVPDWLPALPSEQARLDATRVVFDTQRQARHRPAYRRRTLPLRRQSSRYQRDDRVFRPPHGGHTLPGGAQRSRVLRAQEHHAVPPQGRGRGGSGRWARARSTCWPIANLPPAWPAGRSSSPSPVLTCWRARCWIVTTAISRRC